MAEAENVALNGGDTATQLGASAMISLATDYHKATGGATDDAYVLGHIMRVCVCRLCVCVVSVCVVSLSASVVAWCVCARE